MTRNKREISPDKKGISRRDVLATGAAGVVALLTGGLARGSTPTRAFNGEQMPFLSTDRLPGSFVYTEVQNSVPFSKIPWEKRNPVIAENDGFISKTWLSGLGNDSVGGFYSFDSVENAMKYVTGFFPEAQRRFGNAHTSRVFDASVTKEVSIDMGSVHFGIKPRGAPGAFVYTEVQISVPFSEFAWEDRNRALRQTPGLLSKTWLSGLHTQTLGGFDVFDTVENARRFAIETFPETAQKLNAAFMTRVFAAATTEAASRAMHSPCYPGA